MYGFQLNKFEQVWAGRGWGGYSGTSLNISRGGTAGVVEDGAMGVGGCSSPYVVGNQVECRVTVLRVHLY